MFLSKSQNHKMTFGTRSANSPPYTSALKMSDLTRPGPSDVSVLMDEHMNTINDSHFLPYRNLMMFDQQWLGVPTGRHGNAAGIAYADGHAEIHQWRDSDVTAEIVTD